MFLQILLAGTLIRSYLKQIHDSSKEDYDDYLKSSMPSKPNCQTSGCPAKSIADTSLMSMMAKCQVHVEINLQKE